MAGVAVALALRATLEKHNLRTLRWHIVSAGKRNHASRQLTGCSIGVKGGATVALPRPEDWIGRRSLCDFLGNVRAF
jgi:hypothetical protein